MGISSKRVVWAIYRAGTEVEACVKGKRHQAAALHIGLYYTHNYVFMSSVLFASSKKYFAPDIQLLNAHLLSAIVLIR